MYYNSTVERKKSYDRPYFKQRLKELRQGDPAYSLHEAALMEVVVPALDYYPRKPRRILDMGCGLGFMTPKFAQLGGVEAVGVDPSKLAISLAKKEHRGVKFYAKPAESFSHDMPALGERPFDIAVLNMVLHSVDDTTALRILRGVHQCLNPGDMIAIVVPTPLWLMRKLIEYAKDQNMEKVTGVNWVRNMLANQCVELHVKISDGKYYKNPITVFNRSFEEYVDLFQRSNFGIELAVLDDEGHILDRRGLPCLEITDSFSNGELADRKRLLIKSFALPNMEN